jgi:hypothetical protein
MLKKELTLLVRGPFHFLHAFIGIDYNHSIEFIHQILVALVALLNTIARVDRHGRS